MVLDFLRLLMPKCPARMHLSGSKGEEVEAEEEEDAAVEGVPMALPAGAVAYENIPYVTDGHERQMMDLYIPRHAAHGGLLPLILYIHPGRWQYGSKENFDNWNCEYFLEAGYAVCSANFRILPDYIFPSQVEDLKAAIRWLRAHAAEYQLDPQRFGCLGASSGGHLSAMLGTTGNTRDFDVGENLEQSSSVQAAVDFYGAIDFSQMDENMESEDYSHNAADSPESIYIGGAIQDNPDLVARANSITYISADTPPFLICHGDQDAEIPHHQSALLAAALREAGVPTSFYTVAGAGHVSFRGLTEVECLTRLFFSHVLKPGSYCQP